MFFLEDGASGLEFGVGDVAKDAGLRAIEYAAATVVGCSVAFVDGDVLYR